MIGRKKKREVEKEGEEENGLHNNKSLLEYQNKSLCTLILDLREKLKTKEESYTSLESKFNSTISFFNKFTSMINTLNEDISSALSKNKLSINEDIIPKEKKAIYSSPSEFLHNLLGNAKTDKSEKSENIQSNSQASPLQQTSLVNSTSNNKIIVDDDEEDEEMKDVKNSEMNEKESEFEPMLNLVKNMDIFINKLLPIIKLNEEQYEKLFSNVDEEIANKNKEQEEIINDLNKSLSNYKMEIESLKTQNEINLSKLNELQQKIENLNSENFKLHRKINTHPLMPLLVLESQCLNKRIEQHNCVCSVCGKNFNEENQNENTKEGNNEQNSNNQSENISNDNNKNVDNKISESKNENNTNKKNNTENNDKDNEAMEELTKDNEALRKKIRELHDSIENNSGSIEITE